MALLETFTEDFGSALDGAKWGTFGTAAASGGQLVVACRNTYGNGIYQIVDGWDLEGSYLWFQADGFQGGTPTTCMLAYKLEQSDDNTYSVSWEVDLWNNLTAKYAAGAGDQVLRQDTAWNATTHKFLRIREDSGTVYYDYSSDGSSWNNYTSVAVSTVGININDVKLVIFAGAFGADQSSDALSDNVNTGVANDVEVSATTDALTLTEQTADVNLNVSVAAGVDSLTLTELAASIKADINVAAGTDSLTLTGLDAGINAETSVLASFDALTITGQPATVNAETNVLAGVDELTLTELEAGVSLGTVVSADAASLTLTEFGATVNAETNVQVSVASMTLATLSATVESTVEEEEPDVGDLGPSAGATVLQSRKPRGLGGSLSWEKFLRIMEDLEQREAALVAKEVKGKQKRKVEAKIERTAAKVRAAANVAGPQVNPDIERLNRALAAAQRARQVTSLMTHLDTVQRIAAGIEAAIMDEEEVEMLLLVA